MIVAIHQPNFIPWLGYFQKIKMADIFILYDTAQYSKNSFINRNKILIAGQLKWFTIPVQYRHHSTDSIGNILVNPKNLRLNKISKTLRQEYQTSSFFDRYFPDFMNLLSKKREPFYLADLNSEIIKWFCLQWKIDTEIVRASGLNVEANNATQHIVDLCKKVGGKTYLSGVSGKGYLTEKPFEEERMSLQYLNTDLIVSRFGYLSALHWLFEKGENLFTSEEVK